jgi:LPPG:FO 2-phospho-L-lactate transferase
MRVAVLAGGTGGAMLAQGFHEALEPGAVGVVCNTGDDTFWHGLLVSPDLDAVLYRLAGIFDEERRYGVAGDTFNALDQVAQLGGESWFRVGDRDLAVCLLRTALLASGLTRSEVAGELCHRFGVRSAVVPMSDAEVRTLLVTDAGELDVQQWFVREATRPRVREVRIAGPREPSPRAVDLVEGADLVVIGPSNPPISLEPILHVLGAHLPRERCLAVSPIVGGEALKGPTIRLLTELGREPTPVGVARGLLPWCSRFVLDRVDAGLAPAVRELGYDEVIVLDTVMGRDGRARLAQEILAAS